MRGILFAVGVIVALSSLGVGQAPVYVLALLQVLGCGICLIAGTFSR